MRTFVSPPARIATDGLVHCPLRRTDTSVDACLACEFVDEVTARAGSDDEVIVRCAPPRSLLDTGAGWIG